MAAAVQLLDQRRLAYPKSVIGRAQYVWALQRANQPRAARAVLREVDPGHAIGGKGSYWWYLAASHHMLGEYEAELDITDRWGDSASREWRVVRGRALAGLGREQEIMELLRHMAGESAESIAEHQLRIAAELWAHGHPGAAGGIAKSVLARVELGVVTGPEQAGNIAWVNRLLGRTDGERGALQQIVASDADTLAKLEAAARIAVLLSDTAAAQRIDSLLALESDAPLRSPWVRGAQILARAHIASGLGRREQAVALLQEARSRGMLDLGSSHAFHNDLLLGPLRGYPPFDALLLPDN
jgi:hypothetical protein